MVQARSSSCCTMCSRLAGWVSFAVLLVVCCSTSSGTVEQLFLGAGPWYRSFESGELYNFSVNTSTGNGEYSAHIFQVHAVEKVKLILRNTSSDCTSQLECETVGTHIGMVQLHSYSSSTFSVRHACVEEGVNCSAVQLVLVAVVGIPLKHPIPGGCSLTSALEIEASLGRSNNSLAVTFQNSGIGYDPLYTSPPPCTDQFRFITRLEYMVYQKCVPSPTVNSTFKTLEGMLSVERIDSDIWHFPFTTLSYSAIKKVTSYAAQQQGLVLNVVARDTKTGTTSAYIPTVLYDCDYTTGQCDYSLSSTTWACVVLVGVMGLYLCLLAHRFFHVEVFLFTLLISVYIMYIILMAATDWSGAGLAVAMVVFGLCLTILFFTLWFFTNAYFLFLTMFGATMGFIITATILYTPLGSYDLVKVSYIYTLILLSGMFLWMVPFVFFPTALSIVSSAVVGSYAITFSIGLIVRSTFSDIVLRVARNAAIPGHLSVSDYCQITNTDGILIFAWVVLGALSITIQAIIEVFRRRSFKRKQALTRKYNRTDSDLVEPVRRQYSAFPSISLFKRLKRGMTTRRSRSNMQFPSSSSGSSRTGETRPLLSPSRLSANRYT